MKKILSIVLLLAILSGCTAADIPEMSSSTGPDPTETSSFPDHTTDADDTTQPENEQIPDAVQLPMVAVSVPITTNTVTADDGSTICRRTTQSMYLTLQDPDIADKIIVDFLNRIDAHSSAVDEIQQAAQRDYSVNDNWNTYFYDLIYSPTRVDHSVLSLYGNAISYNGGNHPSHVCLSANYNMVTGDVLTLGSILYHIDSLNKLEALVLEKLESLEAEKYLMDGYENAVHHRFARDESFDEDWYFSNNGLCFYFSPYEIAPYASGVIVAEIPYSELTGIIADDFFPPEEDIMDGSVQVSMLEDVNLDDFTQIAEVILDQDAQGIFLYAERAVRNVSIETVTHNSDGAKSEMGYTVFSTYTLTPGDGIMLQAQIPDGVPILRISYETGTETLHFCISRNSEDGSVLLIPE